MSAMERESYLKNWVDTHGGRLWCSEEELSEIMEQTRAQKANFKNWFASQRKSKTKEVGSIFFNKPEDFLLAYGMNEADVLVHSLSEVNTSGNLPEAERNWLEKSPV
jgi:hypothetical protein